MSRGRGIITTNPLFMGKTGIAYPSVCPIPKNVPISAPFWFMILSESAVYQKSDKAEAIQKAGAIRCSVYY